MIESPAQPYNSGFIPILVLQFSREFDPALNKVYFRFLFISSEYLTLLWRNHTKGESKYLNYSEQDAYQEKYTKNNKGKLISTYFKIQ